MEAVFPYVHKRRLWKKIPYEPKGQQLRMNPPHEIRDLLPYEPERQQLRMAVTTDELSIRGQRPTKAQPNPVRNYGRTHTTRHMNRKLYHRCKTPMRIRTPKSANHNNVSSMNFAESRNWPPCRSKSNVKIRRERDLLAQFRGQLTESARPESSRPESD
ncbi:hypothetical protein V8E54_014932 [Elaphomyces granulatus]